jgi:putative restriction endonuclease
MPLGSTTSVAYPFSRLKTDGFWQRISKPGYDPIVEYNVKSMARLREIYVGAKMDDDLFRYLCNPETWGIGDVPRIYGLQSANYLIPG